MVLKFHYIKNKNNIFQSCEANEKVVYQIMLIKKFRLWPDRVKRIFEDKNLKILFFIIVKSHYYIKKLITNWYNSCLN